MENTAPSRSHQRAADTMAELIGSAWKSLQSTPAIVWLSQPMRSRTVTGWVESMRKSARSVSTRSAPKGAKPMHAPQPFLRAAVEPIQSARPFAAPVHPIETVPKTAQPTLERLRLLLPKVARLRNPLRDASIAELVDLARRHECPRCHGAKFRRSRPRSVEWLICLARVVPYRCYSCNWRFFGLSVEHDPVGQERETETSLWYTHQSDPTNDPQRQK
jgi:hypothetical protein